MGEGSGINRSGKTCVVHSMGALEKVRIKKKAMRVHSWAKGDFWGNLPFLSDDHGKSSVSASVSSSVMKIQQGVIHKVLSTGPKT